jgi:hypothetical protein
MSYGTHNVIFLGVQCLHPYRVLLIGVASIQHQE